MVACLAIVTGSVTAELVMPVWSEESRQRVGGEDWIPGGALLLETEEATPEDGTGVKPPTAAETVKEEKPDEIQEHYLEAYFAQRPETFLVDPQGLLDPVSARDRTAFLDYHSSDSQIDFYVYLFGEGQRIPAEVREEELSERLFGGGKPALVLFYYLGEPKRSEVFLSPQLTDSVSDAERRRMIKSSVLAASEKGDAIAQLEAFCVQTAIRIYWMEKAAGLLVGERVEPVVAKPVVEEVAASPNRLDGMKEQFGQFWWDWGAVVSVSLAGALFAFGGWWYARFRARYRFPDFEVAPRLGGDHAAGIGAVIAFGSTTQSPSAQESGVPDYFGGI